jgi:hypothetical protein
MAKDGDEMIREYLAEIGRKGGQERAKRHGKAKLSKWAKLGGRPPKAKKAAKSPTGEPKRAQTHDKRGNKR